MKYLHATSIVMVIVCNVFHVKAAILRVPSGYASIQEAISAASDGDTVLVANGTYGIDDFIDILGKAITVKSENGSDSCVIDGAGFTLQTGEGYETLIEGFTVSHALLGLSINNTSPIIRGCVFTDNHNPQGTGGIACRSSSAWIIDCIISNNSASNDEEGLYGGAISVCSSSENPVRFMNCIIAHNRITVLPSYLPMMYYGIAIHACAPVILNNCLIYDNYYDGDPGPGSHQYGPAVDGMVHRIVLDNCTITNNTSWGECGGVNFGQLLNCIVYFNSGVQLDHSFATYSDIAGGYSGDGNIDSDPLFISGPLGDYYLSHTSSGQQTDSPCIDRGSDLAENLFIELPDGNVFFDELTTRTDHIYDQSLIDMGYHYRFFPTQTPIITTTPTPPPFTPTPIITSTPESEAEFRLFLNQNVFNTGDQFALRALCRGSQQHTVADLYVVLDINGEYWFWPSWSQELHCEAIQIQADRLKVVFILDFLWPDASGSLDGILIWGAMTEPSSVKLIGTYDVVEFSYY